MAWKLFRFLRHTSFEALPALPRGTPCLITDEDTLCIRTANGWRRILASDINAANAARPSVAATPHAPVTRDSAGRSQISSPSAAADIANRAYVDQQIAALAMPVGAPYIQFPGMAEPGVIWAGTWTNISSSFAGAFFRAEGGRALAFGGGVQAGQNASHDHAASSGVESADHSHPLSGGIGGATIRGGFSTGWNASGVFSNDGSQPTYGYGGNSAPGQGNISMNADHGHTLALSCGPRSATHTHSITVAAAGGDEPRPINITIRIWRRTA